MAADAPRRRAFRACLAGVVACGLVTANGAGTPAAGQVGGPYPKTTAVPKLVVRDRYPKKSFVVLHALVRRVPRLSTVILRCTGPGCRIRFARRQALFDEPTVEFRAIRGMRTSPGTRISILVSHPAQTGIVHTFTFTRAGGLLLHKCAVAPGSLEQDC
jgi:hypothetical protein